MFWMASGLELAPIGGQLFAHDNSQRDCTAFRLPIVTYATRLLAQPLRAICNDTGLCCIIEVRKDTPKSSARRSARTSRSRCQVRRRPRLRRGRFRGQALRRLASRGETPRPEEAPQLKTEAGRRR